MSESERSQRQTVGALAGALLAGFLIVTVGWLPSWITSRDDGPPVDTVDFSGELALARSQASYDVLAPSPLPAGWRATSVNWSGDGPEMTWHLGLLTGPDSSADYVGLEQSNADANDVIARFPANQPGPAVLIQGATWVSLASADGREHALVLTTRDVTTLVTGTAPESDLEAFAASLSSS